MDEGLFIATSPGEFIGQFSRVPADQRFISCQIPEPYESIIIDYFWRLSSDVPTTFVAMHVNGIGTPTYNTSWTAFSGAAFIPGGGSGAFVNVTSVVAGLIPRNQGQAYGRAILHRAAATGSKGLFFIEYWLHNNSDNNHGVVIGGGTTPSTGAVTALDFVTGTADTFSADSYVRLYGLRP